MRTRTKTVVWFDEVGKNDVGLVGGKGANLGEMTRAGIPVPPGFIVTADAYFSFLAQANLAANIKKILASLDPHDSDKLQRASAAIMTAISGVKMPEEIGKEILVAYKRMGDGPVAVRSSATAEDLPDASFAGQQSTYLNVEGETRLLEAVQDCWASLFQQRAIFYRAERGYDHLKVGIAVPVQRMVQSEVSGVLFTVDPMTGDREKILIEAAYGLGESVVSGETTPDMYVVEKRTMGIVERSVAIQPWKLVRNLRLSKNGKDANIKVDMPEAEGGKQKLTDDCIVELARLAGRIERHYGSPQDIEWAREDGRFYIVQSRPVTTLKEEAEEERGEEPVGNVLVKGSQASPGVVAGPVKVILDASEIGKVLEGDILVAEMTTPDFVPAMKRAVGIVTDRGGRTCHAAIVSRELGIPCVVGTGNATHALKTGQVVTVDGATGRVYEGDITDRFTAVKEKTYRGDLKTTTRLYVNLAEPDLADVVAKRNVDGVGLLRAEFIIARIGEHPSLVVKEGRQEEYITKLAEGLTKFAAAFHPRPVVYRTNDFKTNEYSNLKGGQEFEQFEENPMIGYRGCSRYVRESEAFRLEIEAIKRVRERYNNLWVMIPFVRTVEELAKAKKIMDDDGLSRSKDFKLWMMVEVPSNVFLLDRFLDVGIDGISIGSNDLTQLILGIDRDNSKFAEEFDERNPAVMMALESVITRCKARGVSASICGQAPSFYPDLTEKLVEWGITSVSVSPDMIERTREIIANAEERLGKAPQQ
ncbi:MAG: phosphoenolpyruvate synthase [Chloroflexi bacterium]|nr:phosphoenolpyruvate synthase [Chloroflexota bacterium]